MEMIKTVTEITLTEQEVIDLCIDNKNVIRFDNWEGEFDLLSGEMNPITGVVTNLTFKIQAPTGEVFEGKGGIYYPNGKVTIEGNTKFTMTRIEYADKYLLMRVANSIKLRLYTIEVQIGKLEKILFDNTTSDFLKERAAVQKECLQAELNFLNELKSLVDR